MYRILGTIHAVEKTSPKNMVSSWLGSLGNTVKYGNHMFDVVHKKTSGVVNVLPSKGYFSY